MRKGVIKPQETPCSQASTPKTRVLCGKLSPITISLREGVNLQLQLIKIPGSGKSPGEGNGNPLQYSCLENPLDRGAWQAI